MGFIKKNLFLIGCVAIVLVALVLFALGFLRQADNAKELASSQTVYSTVSRINPPTKGALAEAQAQAAQVRGDAAQIVKLASQTSVLPLLADDIFPETKRNIQLTVQNFATRYCELLQSFRTQLQAGDIPTEEERRQHLARNTTTAGGGGFGGGMFGGANPADKQQSQLLEDLYKRQAGSFKIYARLQSFMGYEYWKLTGEDPGNDYDLMMKNFWYSQVAAWIQQDVVSTIAELNKPAGAVADAPVKRLVEISFAGEALGQVNSGGATAATADKSSIQRRVQESINKMPIYVAGDSQAGGMPGFGLSSSHAGEIAQAWTAHKSDDKVDIVQFEIQVVLDAGRITDFINALQSPKTFDVKNQKTGHDQITILQMMVTSVNSQNELDPSGYYYGPGAVVKLQLICEYFFFKIPGPVDRNNQKLYLTYEDLKPKQARPAAAETGTVNNANALP